MNDIALSNNEVLKEYVRNMTKTIVREIDKFYLIMDKNDDSLMVARETYAVSTYLSSWLSSIHKESEEKYNLLLIDNYES